MGHTAERISGRVAGLFTCASAGLPMERREQVVIKAGTAAGTTAGAGSGGGIEGDRYALGIGAYSAQQPVKVRHVTFITQEGIDVANEWQEASGLPGFTMELTRRNVLLEGMPASGLNALVGCKFKVGDLEFIGLELATPCHRPGELSGLEGFIDAFEGRGGLRAQACSDGVLRVGDVLA